MRTRSRVLTLLLVCALGTTGGIAAARLGPDGGGPKKAASTVNDPLDLGVPLVSLGCDGSAIMVVATGDNPAPLAVGVANNPDGSVRYLRTDESCDTIYTDPDPDDPAATPEYVAYLGPFDGPRDACSERMTLEHRGDSVTVLHAGNETFVHCVCVLPSKAAPELSLGMETDAEKAIWVRQLQALLVDLGPGRFPEANVTGKYDEATVARIRELQDRAFGTSTGIVDEATWRLVQDRTCQLYSF